MRHTSSVANGTLGWRRHISDRNEPLCRFQGRASTGSFLLCMGAPVPSPPGTAEPASGVTVKIYGLRPLRPRPPPP